MKYFIVTVLSKGVKENIPLYARDRKEANHYAKLKHSGIIIKVTEAKEPLENRFRRFKTSFFQNIKKRKIKPDALISAIRQLAVMSNAGISIHDSLYEIHKSSHDENLKYIFSKLADDINAGHSLSASMESFRYELGNLTIAMVQLGEKTGNLDESLYALADMLEEIRANTTKFKKAMAYPRNVLIAMTIAFIVLIAYVVPEFKSTFDQLNSDLPLPTQILLTLENLFNNYGALVLLLLLLGFITVNHLINTSRNFKYSWHEILLNTYLLKDIIKYATLSRFTLVFSKLLKAGIPISEALDTSISMIDNLPLKNRLMSVRITVEKGGSLNQGLKETKLFENMIIQMVNAGEDSGKLDSMMEKVAEYFKMKFNAIIDGLSDAVEPIMLIVIASMVVLLALGIFMPMWEMGNAAQVR